MRETVRDYEEAVLDIVAMIPAGKVLTYGDIAEILERGGPRQVGAVMSRASSGLPWWRVLRADGKLPGELVAAAVEQYVKEATPLRSGGRTAAPTGEPSEPRVDLRRARWNPAGAEQVALQRIRESLGGTAEGVSIRMSEADDWLRS